MDGAQECDVAAHNLSVFPVCQHFCTEVIGGIHDFTVFNGEVVEQAVSVFTEENVELLAVWIVFERHDD